MTSNQVRSFLRFVTGSTVCSVQSSNILELSSTYTSYLEFEKELRLVLADDVHTWIMDAL